MTTPKPGLSPGGRRAVLLLALASLALLAPIGYLLGRAIVTALAPYAIIIGVAVLLLLLAAALAGLRILFATGRHASARARQAELATMQNGQPIHLDDVSRLAGPLLARSLARHYDVETIRAGVSPTLSHFHQEIHPALPAAPSIVTLPPAPELPPQLPAAPDLARAIKAGWSAPDRWLIGIDAGGNAQTAALKHTGMVAVSGVPGTGKTSAAAWLAAQTAAHGGVLFVADPHYGDPESLSARIEPFAGAVERFATTPEQINALILQVAKIYDRRCNHPSERTMPVLLLIDEFMQLMLRKQLTDESERALATLAGGGRKKDMFGALISQNWSAAAMGQKVTILRQIVTGSLVHQSDEETAKFLLPRSYATAAATLAPGEALWFGSSAPIAVRVPYLSPADAALAARPHQPRPHRLAGDRAQAAQPPAQTVPPTERVSTPPAPPTTTLPPLTNQEQILLLLESQPHLTSSAIAQRLGLDLQVARVEISNLYRQRALARRDAPRGSDDRYEYSLSKPLNQLMPARAALSA